MATNELSKLYEEDVYTWAMRNAELIRQGRFDEIDVDHVAEEIESVGKSERRELENRLIVLLSHLLKWQLQPGLRGASWRQSLRNRRITIQKTLQDSPSLAQRLPEMLTNEYPAARADAIDETGLSESIFPEACPFTLEQILNKDFWPD